MDQYSDRHSEPESELSLVTGVVAGIETTLVGAVLSRVPNLGWAGGQGLCVNGCGSRI